MLLKEFVTGSINGFIKAERYLNDGSPSGFSSINTTSEHTRPKAQLSSFNLKLIRFRKDLLIEDFGEYKPNLIKDGCIFIHPDMLNSLEFLNNLSYIVEDELIVAPTASGRTVVALKENYFIKLAYIGFLGRLVRHMSAEMVRSACEVTKQLIEATRTKKLNGAFSFLREDFGRVAHVPSSNLGNIEIELPLNEKGCYEWGVLFREMKPFPYLSEDEYLIPFFALFSKEYDPITGEVLTVQDKPLLIQLFENQDKSMIDFLLEDILFPLFNTYFDALIFAGIELEAHAQNMLITISKEFKVKRIVCRDLESAGRDVPVMEYMGINHISLGKYKYNVIRPIEVGQKYPKYYINHSFMFDFKLGEYSVTPLIELALKYDPFDYNTLILRIKEFNGQFIRQLPGNFFPPDWCCYDNLNWELERLARIYIWQDQPKYR